jgi:hypothetical protein
MSGRLNATMKMIAFSITGSTLPAADVISRVGTVAPRDDGSCSDSEKSRRGS